MLERSIHQAEQKLISAREAYEAYESAKAKSDIDAAKRHWWLFLESINGVFLKIEQGVKCCDQCATWFGKFKYHLKTDPLLHYIQHARNSAEHGLEEIVPHAPQSLNFDPVGPTELGFHLAGFQFEGQTEENPAPAKITVGYTDGTVKDVTKLYKQTYGDRQFVLAKVSSPRHPKIVEPPKKHLEFKLKGNDPSELAGLALSYFDRMIAESKILSCNLKTRARQK